MLPLLPLLLLPMLLLLLFLLLLSLLLSLSTQAAGLLPKRFFSNARRSRALA